MVDDNSEPLILYHGAAAKFDEFVHGKSPYGN